MKSDINFLPVWPTVDPHVSGENGHREKASFQKRFPELEFLKLQIKTISEKLSRPRPFYTYILAYMQLRPNLKSNYLYLLVGPVFCQQHLQENNEMKTDSDFFFFFDDFFFQVIVFIQQKLYVV